MLTDEHAWSKYTKELLNGLEYWIENCEMVDHSPFKDNLVIKQNRNGEIVRETITNVPIRVPKMMLKCNPRQLHNHTMIESFEDAIGKGNTVIISESKLQDILKTEDLWGKVSGCARVFGWMT